MMHVGWNDSPLYISMISLAAVRSSMTAFGSSASDGPPGQASPVSEGVPPSSAVADKLERSRRGFVTR